MPLEGTEYLVLQALDSIQGEGNHFVEDSRIADATNLSLELVRDWLIRLSEHEMVAVAQTSKGLSAFLEARGRIEIKQVQQRRSWATKGTIPALPLPVSGLATGLARLAHGFDSRAGARRALPDKGVIISEECHG
jgi:hypothetical protein